MLFLWCMWGIFLPQNILIVCLHHTLTLHANLPVLVLPGDNDWTDCEYPDVAWNLWSRNFMGFEHKWNSTSHIPKHVERQKERNENFSFKHADVLFLGLNIIGGKKSDGAGDWDRRFQECYDWARKIIRAQDDLLRAVIIFGHAAKFSDLFEMVAKQVAKANIPFIYINGNGHKWRISQPNNSYKNFWQVQVDQGRTTNSQMFMTAFYTDVYKWLHMLAQPEKGGGLRPRLWRVSGNSLTGRCQLTVPCCRTSI